MRTDTAHQAWDTRWSTAEGRAEWEMPDPDVCEVAKRLGPVSQSQSPPLTSAAGLAATP